MIAFDHRVIFWHAVSLCHSSFIIHQRNNGKITVWWTDWFQDTLSIKGVDCDSHLPFDKKRAIHLHKIHHFTFNKKRKMMFRYIRNQKKNLTHLRLCSFSQNTTCRSIVHRSLFSSTLLEHDTDTPRRSWQAQHNIDIQRVTEKAIVSCYVVSVMWLHEDRHSNCSNPSLEKMHELTKQQTETMERMVPWFLKQMPRWDTVHYCCKCNFT
jgi:hypothetical protein